MLVGACDDPHMGIRAVFVDDKAFLFLVHETPTFALQVMRSMAATIRRHDESY